MTTPGKPITGGTALRIPAVASPNFTLSPLAGWALMQDGSFYAADATVSGDVTATAFDGTDFVINEYGGFFYSGTPAFGNLIASIAPAAGTDAYGNAYLEGPAAYNPGSPSVATSLFGGISLLEAANPGGPYWDPLFALTYNGGAASLDSPFNSTAGTAANPTVVTTDTWHAMTLANGWAHQAGNQIAQYRLAADGDIEVRGAINGSAATAATFCSGLGYTFGAVQQFWCQQTSGNAAVYAQATTGGALEIAGEASFSGPYVFWGKLSPSAS